MKKNAFSALLFVLVAFIANAFAQDESYVFKVSSINISTERSLIMSGFGSFGISGIDENGNSVSRSANYGSFVFGSATNCTPCRKGTEFNSSASPASISFLTSGNSQNPPQEWATFSGQITYPSWSLPIQAPRSRLLVKYIPVRYRGTVTIRKNTGASTITYTDSNVDLTGFVRMEFAQMPFDSKLFEWKSYQITASETP